jgi:hypothetical protein
MIGTQLAYIQYKGGVKMFCPTCGQKYPEGSEMCPNCNKAKVQPVEFDESAEVELETIFVGADKAELVIVESLLQDAGFKYMFAYKEMEGIFGWGNSIAGPLEIKVKKEDAEEVTALLKAFREELSEDELNELTADLPKNEEKEN